MQNFELKDTEDILKILISLSGRTDSLFWNDNASGIYTIKSSYKLCERMEDHSISPRREQEESSDSSNKRRGWKNLLQLPVKQKLKHFLWKCLNNYLPVNELLAHRFKIAYPRCKYCGDAIETIQHALLLCNKAHEIYKLAPL